MKRRGMIAAAAALVLFGASPALAATMTSPDGGAKAWASQTNSQMNVRDAKCDGHWVYGNWNNTGNRMENKAGCNKTLSGPVSSITAVRACTEIPLGTDSCSNWG